MEAAAVWAATAATSEVLVVSMGAAMGVAGTAAGLAEEV